MLLVIVATFCGLPTSEWHRLIADSGWWTWARQHLLSFHGLDDLIHADTMLFILGLTLFVSVIAQTRLLEGDHLFPAAAERRPDPADRHFRNGRRRLRLRHSRRRLDDRADDPDARDHHDARRRAQIRGALRGHGLHRGDDDLRHLAGLRRAAEPDHEGEPVPLSGQRLLPALLRARRPRQLPSGGLAAAREARPAARQPRGDGRHRRERRGRAFSAGHVVTARS